MFGKKKPTASKKTAVTKSIKKSPVPKETTAAISKKKASVPKKTSVLKMTSVPEKEPEFVYIADDAHYEKVIERIKSVKKTLWIGTADIKDLYVKKDMGEVTGRKTGSNRRNDTKPLLEVLSDLAEAGVEIRLIHAKEPGPAFRTDFDRYPALLEGMERILCPRVHFKMIVFDQKLAYVGSANLTGAGLGMKGDSTRNFEAGVLSSSKDFVRQAADQFDKVWMGSWCKDCRRKKYCSDPIV